MTRKLGALAALVVFVSAVGCGPGRGASAASTAASGSAASQTAGSDTAASGEPSFRVVRRTSCVECFDEPPVPEQRLERTEDGSGWLLRVGDQAHPVPTANVEQLAAFIEAHRPELLAECVDRSIEDGGGVTYTVTTGAETFEFGCWNATTEAFQLLESRFESLPNEATEGAASATAPRDFEIRYFAASADPSQRPAQRVMHRIAPSSQRPGSFVVLEETLDASERVISSRQRDAVTAAVEELYAYIEAHAAALGSPCRDDHVQDGAIRTFEVVSNGQTRRFSCYHRRTPEFEGVQTRFQAAVAAALAQ